MNKKTIQADTYRIRKTTNKTSSAINLSSKSNNAIQSAEKAIQHNSSQIKIQSKDKKCPVPKNKFTSRNPTSELHGNTSRIKNFPAEAVKRVKCSAKPEVHPFVQQPEDPQQHYLKLQGNFDQTDSLHRHVPLPKSPRTGSVPLINQHHLPHSECRNTRPDVLIPQCYLKSKNQVQAHRPFVPASRTPANKQELQVTKSLNFNPTTSTPCQPDNFEARGGIKKPMTQECPQIEGKVEKTLDNSINDLDECLKEAALEKQPVGGRSALIHRLKCMSQKQAESSGKNSSHHNVDHHSQQIDRCTFPEQNYIGNSYHDFYNVQRPTDDRLMQSRSQDHVMHHVYKGHDNHHSNYVLPHKSCPSDGTFDRHIKPNQHSNPPTPLKQSGYPPRKCSTTQSQKSSKEINPQFTPEMMQRQQSLIKTMKKHNISDNVINQQLDILQHAHKWESINQKQHEESADENRTKGNRRKCIKNRNGKIEEDCTPEWMARITPPRMTYAAVERQPNHHLHQSCKANKNIKTVRFDGSKEHESMTNLEMQQVETNNSPPYNNYHSSDMQNTMGRPSGNQHCNCHQCLNRKYLNHQDQATLNYNDGHLMQRADQRQQNYPVNVHEHHLYDPRDPSANNPNLTCNFNNNNNHNNNVVADCNMQNWPQENIKRTKSCRRQNNGLQDEETIKAATEELTNCANQKGFEYLENLKNQSTTDKKLLLNGIQDSNDERLKNLPFLKPCSEVEEKVRKTCANGLENKRNPNNPQPPANLHKKKCNETCTEYPRRTDELCHETGSNTQLLESAATIMEMHSEIPSIPQTDGRDECQQFTPASKYPLADNNTKNPVLIPASQCHGQIIGPYDYRSGYQLVRSNSLPVDACSDFHQYPENSDNIHDELIKVDDAIECVQNNCHQQSMPDSNCNECQKHNDAAEQLRIAGKMFSCGRNNQNNLENNMKGVYQIFEPRIINGIKYFSRKFIFIPNFENLMNNTSLNASILCKHKK